MTRAKPVNAPSSPKMARKRPVIGYANAPSSRRKRRHRPREHPPIPLPRVRAFYSEPSAASPPLRWRSACGSPLNSRMRS
jgi:hypothetical protein